MKIVGLSMALALSAIPAAGQDAALASSYSTLDSCEQVSAGDVDAGRDWVAHRCEGFGGIPVWMQYSDSARLSIGFGPRENLSGMFHWDRDAAWPVEWRGVYVGHEFTPFAAIIRMERPRAGVASDGQSALFVYRLREDGTSCLIAQDITSNEAARIAADNSLSEFTCLSEPYLPERS